MFGKFPQHFLFYRHKFLFYLRTFMDIFCNFTFQFFNFGFKMQNQSECKLLLIVKWKLLYIMDFVTCTKLQFIDRNRCPSFIQKIYHVHVWQLHWSINFTSLALVTCGVIGRMHTSESLPSSPPPPLLTPHLLITLSSPSSIREIQNELVKKLDDIK